MLEAGNGIDSLAQALRSAYEGTPIAPLRTHLPPRDVEAAYAVQEANTHFWIAEGRRVVGAKIGLTSPAIQRQLGVDQPDFGLLFADMAVGDGLTIPRGRVAQPRIEAEIALILGAGLEQPDATVADVILATAYVTASLEIVGSRIAGWDIDIVDTVADNASAGPFVLGGPARRLDAVDLQGADMTLTRGGEVVSSGSGAACLGHPLNAAVWLARELARRGRPLSAGDVVLTGALGPMVPVNPGDVFEAKISGVGSVSVGFAGE